jgi:RND family efflux transporter MFP subunit
MKRISYIIIIGTLISTAGYFLIFARNAEEPNKAAGLAYTTIQLRDLTQYVTATGVIKPQVGSEVKVGAQVSGIVKDLYVEIGSKVVRNQLLAVIDAGAYQAKTDETAAQIENASTEKKYAELDFQRYKNLYNKNAVTRQEFEAASRKYDLACAGFNQAKANFDYAKLQLDYTKIFSPINGVVSSVATQEGETVAANFTSPTFVTIINLDRLELWAYVDEADIGKVAKGQKVTFFVDTYSGQSFEGVVKTIHPDAEIQNNVVNYIVVVTIKNLERFTLRPQMDATASLYTQCKKDVLVVPKKSVQFDESGKKFVTLLINGNPTKRFVTTGISDEKNYEVTSGLMPGDKVILN